MTEAVCTEIDGKSIMIYRGTGEALPVVYSNDYGKSGEAVLKRCREIGCPPFHLVSVFNVGWDQNMSPWPSEPVVAKDDHFTGNAPDYLKWLCHKVIPYAEDTLKSDRPSSYIAGYSMAGLFALWSLYETDFFKGAVCASGSLWYPGFRDFALSRELKRKPAGIYLSLGDRESSGRNPVLQKTESVFRDLNQNYINSGIPSLFELNPGNHYRDMDLRMAKGYRWLLSR